MRAFFPFVALWALSPALVLADVTYAWKDATPSVVSASVTQVVPHPLDGRRLVLRGSFRFAEDGPYYPVIATRDGGSTWSPAPGDTSGLGVVVPDPRAPGTIYSGIYGYISRYMGIQPAAPGAPGRVFRSDDFGDTWTLVGTAWDDGLSFLPFGTAPTEAGRVFSLATREGGCGVIYPGCRYTTAVGIGVSRDRGSTWEISPGMASTELIEEIDVEAPVPAAPTRMFAVTKTKLYVTTDSAATWNPFDGPVPSNLRAIRADPKRANVLFAIRQARDGIDGEVLRSDDGGLSWRQVLAYSNWSRYEAPPRLVVDPDRTSELWLAGLASGVQHSSDGGQSWVYAGFDARTGTSYTGEVLADPNEIVRNVIVNPAEPGIVYVVKAGRLYRGTPSVRRDPVIAEFQYAGDRYWNAVTPGEANFQAHWQEPGEIHRTGLAFGAWRADDAPAGALASCRFWGNAAQGQHSRFITLQGPECEALKRSPAYLFEGEGDFYAVAPGPRGCPAGLAAVRRLFNGQQDRNHRWFTDSAIAAEMRARGWIEEGIAFCARPLGENE